MGSPADVVLAGLPGRRLLCLLAGDRDQVLLVGPCERNRDMKEKVKTLDLLKLIAAIVLCQLAGGIGAFATAPAISTWYQALQKPSFSPPHWIFAPVWLVLYTLMGISLFLVWRGGLRIPEVRRALVWFFIQLTLNALWSWAFFGLRSPLWGLIDISLLWIAIGLTLLHFWKISRMAGLLLVPYILWVSFAALLNFSIYRLNP